MICVLHGYLLEGSGSNLWTRSILEALCRQGHHVHLMAQENHPERYPFIAASRRYYPDGSMETWHRQESPYPGSCVLHKPVLGDTLPVFVWDRYEEFSRVIPMVELTDDEIEAYITLNARTLARVVGEFGITALHANHSVLMPQVAERVSAQLDIPFAVMPHGSALEYAVKRDERFLRLAEQSFNAARRIFVIGDEMRNRVRSALPQVSGLESKFMELHLGVDTSQFMPVSRAQRNANIAKLAERVTNLPTGRTAEQTNAFLAQLHVGMTDDRLMDALDSARSYDDKSPDADLIARLSHVDWEHDDTLLFVGRIISTKGLHAVIAALPLLLEQRPRMKLIIVGHGPLREPLEAVLWALEHGDRDVVEWIFEYGRVLEGEPQGETGNTYLTQAFRFIEQLRDRGELDHYYEAARTHVRRENVIFTGYLTHHELRLLFPCCDAAIFPSVVREAGPLVFLEALASGSYPLGTYFGGMKASIDTAAEVLPAGGADAMRLSPQPERTAEDIVRNVPIALQAGPERREALFRLARERYDWSSVAKTLVREMNEM
jgi:glycosyltransferase involved in cell wall biosynthesis